MLFSSKKRERQRQRERRKTRRSAFTMLSKIEVHHAVEDRRSPCTTTFAVPSPLVLLPTTRLGQISLFFSFSFSFLSYFLVLIQLYFIRIGICFVFCVWIMWETGSDRLVLFFFFFSYLLVLIQLYFKNCILFCVLCFVFGLCEKRREWERKKKSRGERKNWYNNSWYNFLIQEIRLLMYSSPSDLMGYYSWGKKKSRFTKSAGAWMEHEQCIDSLNFS